MLSSKEGIGVLGKVFSEEATFELRLGWFKTKGIACVKALGLEQAWRVGNIKEISEARQWGRGW